MANLLLPAFTYQLNNPILHRLVGIGKFDGSHPSLVCADTPDHVTVHSPHTLDDQKKHEKRSLAVNRRITALTVGNLGPAHSSSSDALASRGTQGDVLCVGTESSLLAYDVEDNSDLFFKDLTDGVTCLGVGWISTIPSPLVVVGGNCSVQGFDAKGDEMFWSVAGDNVTALTFKHSRSTSSVGNGGPGTTGGSPSKSGADKEPLLVVGTEDFEIRVLENEEVVCEITENHVVSDLTSMRSNLIGYGLSNGTIGVYDDAARLWSHKSQHAVMALDSFDLDYDGVPELVAGFSDGSLEVRREVDGQLLFSDKFNSNISGLLKADYRMTGNEEIICCAADGQVRGYLPAQEDRSNLLLIATHQHVVSELLDEKQSLIQQLKSFTNNIKQLKSGKLGAGVVPPNTELIVDMDPNLEEKALVLHMRTSNETIIKVVTIYSDKLFGGETIVVHPKTGASAVDIPVSPELDIAASLHVKAVVGHMSSQQDHVFESEQKVERFASYVYRTAPRDVKLPRGKVSFRMPERVNRVALWMQHSFSITDAQAKGCVSGDSLHASFLSVRDHSPLVISISSTHQAEIITDNMELAGDIVQDLCAYLKVTELESVAEFPREMDKFQQVLRDVEEYNAIRLSLSVGIADQAQQLKMLVIQAEDARLLNQMGLMMRMYGDVDNINAELVAEYQKRANNHQALGASLKEVNKMIQRAAKLRMGQAKSALVAACRNSIRKNQIAALEQIIRVGRPGGV